MAANKPSFWQWGTRPDRLDADRAKHENAEPDEKIQVWTFVWTLFAFKMATVFLIYWASQSFSTAALLAATTWFWMAIPAILLGGPLMFRYRLVRVRAKRERLRRQEWMLDEDPAGNRHHTVGSRHDR